MTFVSLTRNRSDERTRRLSGFRAKSFSWMVAVSLPGIIATLAPPLHWLIQFIARNSGAALIKPFSRQRPLVRSEQAPSANLDQTSSTPEISADRTLLRKRDKGHAYEVCGKSHVEGLSASETNLPNRNNDSTSEEPVRLGKILSPDATSPKHFGDMRATSPVRDESRRCLKGYVQKDPGTTCPKGVYRQEKPVKLEHNAKKTCSYSPPSFEDDPLSRQIREIHNDTRKSARIIRDSRARLLEIQKKTTMSEADVKELGDRNELLLREMERFDRLTRNMQKLVGAEVLSQVKRPKGEALKIDYLPGSAYEPPVHHEMKMNHPTVLLTAVKHPPELIISDQPLRSKSEIDLTRKLSESYDMQEKLVADNADLEVKRYILYKELMTKDQNLETSRAQVKRLQGELKLMSKENSLLQEKLSKNNPQGDATSLNDAYDTSSPDTIEQDTKQNNSAEKDKELVEKLTNYKSSKLELEKQLSELEVEVQHIRVEMSQPQTACRGGGPPNTCFQQPPTGPIVPPMTRADPTALKALEKYGTNYTTDFYNCGVCPPCPAPCNPNAPPTPAEREVQKLTIQLRQTEENFKTKVTECAILRTELMKKKEELEKERCQHRELQNKMRELEMKFEGLATHTNMMLGTKEQALEQEINVRALKQCYKEAREEIEELRLLMKEQNDQLQDYRVKYLQAQQLVEEQRRQMDMMDMDNTRISEQINLEIQKVKLKFQEKLQELAPIPELLKATQMRLKDAQQSQAIAEHNAEQLARELNCAREKVHQLLHNSLKPVEKQQERTADDKQMALLQQRIAQLVEANQALKGEIDRLKNNVIRMEEAVLANEKRLQEKMHECAQLGGELDRTRDEAARALQRANERTETLRKCMQTTVAELERQLAASRAQVKTAEKDREELQCRMQCQIKRLNENFEQASLRILGLQTQVQSLRRTTSSTDGEAEEDAQECTCKSFFDNP